MLGETRLRDGGPRFARRSDSPRLTRQQRTQPLRAEGTDLCLAQPAGLGIGAKTKISRASGPVDWRCSVHVGQRLTTTTNATGPRLGGTRLRDGGPRFARRSESPRLFRQQRTQPLRAEGTDLCLAQPAGLGIGTKTRSRGPTAPVDWRCNVHVGQRLTTTTNATGPRLGEARLRDGGLDAPEVKFSKHFEIRKKTSGRS